MNDDIRIPAVNVFYSKGGKRGIFVIAAFHTVTDLSPKSRYNSSIFYITLNVSNSFIERVEERLIVLKPNLSTNNMIMV